MKQTPKVRRKSFFCSDQTEEEAQRSTAELKLQKKCCRSTVNKQSLEKVCLPALISTFRGKSSSFLLSPSLTHMHTHLNSSYITWCVSALFTAPTCALLDSATSSTKYVLTPGVEISQVRFV